MSPDDSATIEEEDSPTDVNTRRFQDIHNTVIKAMKVEQPRGAEIRHGAAHMISADTPGFWHLYRNPEGEAAEWIDVVNLDAFRSATTVVNLLERTHHLPKIESDAYGDDGDHLPDEVGKGFQ